MKCSHSIIVKRKDGTITHAPCGQCRACRANYRNEWKMRFTHELACHQDVTWVQLSYDDLHLALQNMEYRDIDGKFFSLERKEVQDWLKRFRKEIYPLKIRYFGCGEYGGQSRRPHYHLALFGIAPNHPAFGKKIMKSHTGWWHEMPSWPFGMVWVDEVPPTNRVGSYIAKYILKKHKGKDASAYYEANHINPEFVMMSLKPGIGSLLIDKNTEFYKYHPVFELNGKKTPLSRYMVDRVCSNIAKEQARTYEGLDNYEDFYNEFFEQAKDHFRKMRSEYCKKYGLTKTDLSDDWHDFGRQQERNLKIYEKD